MESKSQLIVVLDATAAMGPYWPEFAKLYLEPIVTQLCQNQPASMGFVSQTLMTLITVGAGDAFGGAYNSIRTSRPTFVPYDFLKMFQHVKFQAGGCDTYQPLGDAISVALGVATNEIDAAKKFVVLFTNTDFYSTPVKLFNNFNNRTLSELMSVIKSEDLAFSIIAPRKVHAFKEIFVQATGITTLVSGARPAHMVLLKNLTLPDPPEETEPVPEPVKQAAPLQQQQQQQPTQAPVEQQPVSQVPQASPQQQQPQQPQQQTTQQTPQQPGQINELSKSVS